ncbi:MAG: MarR family winged helix-turn-helix transcriptional regulator [Faecalibacillus sp.]
MEFIDNITKVAKLYELKMQPVMKKYGLLKIEIDVLLFLYNNPQYDKAKDIVVKRGIAKSHVSKAIDLLYKKGLLSIVTDQNDKRINHLYLLEQASPIIQEGLLCQQSFYQVFYKNMSEEDIQKLRYLFQIMNQNVKEELECFR